MSERDIGKEILEGIREIKAHKAGQKTLRTHRLNPPSSPQDIRARLKLSQAAFAGLMGEMVAARGVTVVDDGTIAERVGAKPALVSAGI